MNSFFSMCLPQKKLGCGKASFEGGRLMKNALQAEAAGELIHDSATLMVGGFMGVGSGPLIVI
jgi:hypothetical protein